MDSWFRNGSFYVHQTSFWLGESSEPAPFNPLQRAPVVWLRGDQGLVLDGSSNVSEWQDQSGNGNHISQSTSGERPSGQATLNGMPVVTFDGVDDSLSRGTFVGGNVAQPTTHYVVFEDIGTPSEEGDVDSWMFDTMASATHHARKKTILGSGGAVCWLEAGSVYSFTPPGSEFYVEGITFNGASSVVARTFYDASFGVVNGSNDAGTDGINGLLLAKQRGMVVNPPNVVPFRGSIAEYILVAGADDSLQRRDMFRWLCARWGLDIFYPPATDRRAFFRASSGCTLNGSTVSTWDDLDAIASVTQSTSAAQPTWAEHGIANANGGGRAIIQFDGGDQMTGGFVTSLGDQVTVYAVGRITGTDGALFQTSSSDSVNDGAALLRESGTAKARRNSSSQDSTLTCDGNLHVFSATMAPTETRLWVDGEPGSVNSSSSTLATGNDLTIGRLFGGTLPLTGELAELLVYNGRHPGCVREQIETGLADQYLLPKRFVPTVVSDCWLWLRADSGFSSAFFIATWNSYTAYANSASQFMSGQQPVQHTSGARCINGQAVLDFDGSDDCLSLSTGLGSAAAAEVFIVGRLDADPPAATAQTGHAVWLGNAGASASFPSTGGSISDDFGSNSLQSAGDPTPSLASPFIYNVSAGANWQARLNGVALGSAVSNTPAWTTTPFIGKSNPATSARFYDGVIAEIIVYQRVLSAAERAAVNNYLSARYAIVVP